MWNNLYDSSSIARRVFLMWFPRLIMCHHSLYDVFCWFFTLRIRSLFSFRTRCRWNCASPIPFFLQGKGHILHPIHLKPLRLTSDFIFVSLAYSHIPKLNIFQFILFYVHKHQTCVDKSWVCNAVTINMNHTLDVTHQGVVPSPTASHNDDIT